MTKYLLAYIATLIFMFMVDLIWLSQIAEPLYKAGIGHLMAEKPTLIYAALFYLMYIFGIFWFAVKSNINNSIKSAFINGIIFGFFVYASYDLTNLALLKDWPLKLSIIDITWGVLLSGSMAAFGQFIFNKTNKKIHQHN